MCIRDRDERVHLFLNKSDIISQAYAQAVTDDNKDRVVWGNATYYPIGAHTYGQWQEDAPKNPDALGQDNPQVDYDNVWLDIANDLSKGNEQPVEPLPEPEQKPPEQTVYQGPTEGPDQYHDANVATHNWVQENVGFLNKPAPEVRLR